jgi:hypothetical protein
MTSIIKVDNLQNQCGANIISESANVITIGASGDTVTLAAGASQSGFGRTGTVDWDTTKKTTGFTAVSGNGYFCDTTSAAFTVTLPATPSAGDIVAIADYDGTAGTNAITVARNSSNINGGAEDLVITKNYSAISFVYVDATAGWRSVDTSNIENVQNPFIAATGGTITCDGDYKIHTFTGPGTFTVTNAGTPAGSNSVEYLVVAGGGAGGGCSGGGAGGGAGGLRFASPSIAPLTYPAKPLAAPANLSVTAQGYPITVGAGAANPGGGGSAGPGTPGSPSVFSTITSAGGGSAFSACSPFPNANISGGSGAGSQSSNGSTTRDAGTGNTPPVAPPQGQPGGRHNPYPAGCGSVPTINGGGGGGAIEAGGQNPEYGGDGGGFPTAFGSNGQSCGSFRYYAGGGAGICRGGAVSQPGGLGGGATSTGSPGGSTGTANTGGGGAGARGSNAGPISGGSGIVVIRYKYQ